ncbi:T9SS type A sorting domain-containing protein [Hymenobacter negativus]|uniref:T9SS type A sorting domain-containing protein n=1 Tax=Hymenobacter negativus TaxID=2795026 RepID=A0ABS0QBX1_9BACT|nr:MULTISPECIES: T9SS type A sorting domain-containing protein [Bacteria]MBH8560191.1 T9SS type A sorting domain-containing protein [Hymenobacter negativus]MBH8568114.1 T9SS type A sorting domain-containing protein [Hymenobacter negativus]MBR7207849.1 T9SS type A sorting domain-containing protein [Microvirga sp. STS02]
MKNSTLKFGLLLAALFSASVSMAQTTNYTTIGIIGTATSPTGAATGWDNSTAMTRTVTGGHDWSITMQLSANEAKFRADNAWTVNWGGPAAPASAFPAAVGTMNGPNIAIPTAGRYTVRFNDVTGAYSFTVATSTKAASAAILQLAVAPNPASESASVSYELPATATAAITVQNLMGQSVREFTAVRQNAGLQSQNLPLQGLASGIYLVKLETGALTQTTRLVIK